MKKSYLVIAGTLASLVTTGALANVYLTLTPACANSGATLVRLGTQATVDGKNYAFDASGGGHGSQIGISSLGKLIVLKNVSFKGLNAPGGAPVTNQVNYTGAQMKAAPYYIPAGYVARFNIDCKVKSTTGGTLVWETKPFVSSMSDR